MAIKARCGSCGANFQAKDSLAGKRVKCPKCSQPIVINQPGPANRVASNKPGSSQPKGSSAYNPLLDLLDEVNVKSAVQGPTCPNCAAELRAGAVICVECGYNVETGKRLKTSVLGDDGDGVADHGKTDAGQLLARAEREIDESPIGADSQDFGDGADSFVIAGIAGIILLVLVAICLGIIMSMEQITKYVSPPFISFLASVTMALGMGIWITIVAFMQKPGHGIACICTLGLWCVVFGFMQGKQLILPTVVMLASLLIGLASGIYTYYNWDVQLN